MKTTKSSVLGVEGNAALRQLRIQFVTFEFLLAPAARKEPALIGDGFEIYLEYLW